MSNLLLWQLIDWWLVLWFDFLVHLLPVLIPMTLCLLMWWNVNIDYLISLCILILYPSLWHLFYYVGNTHVLLRLLVLIQHWLGHICAALRHHIFDVIILCFKRSHLICLGFSSLLQLTEIIRVWGAIGKRGKLRVTAAEWCVLYRSFSTL